MTTNPNCLGLMSSQDMDTLYEASLVTLGQINLPEPNLRRRI